MFSTLNLVLRGLNLLNWIAAVLFSCLLVLLLIAPDQFRMAFLETFDNARSADAVLLWLKVVCFTVIPVAAAAHVIFTRLLAILRDAESDEAFSEANARRLSVIAWALLAINVIDLAFGQLSVWASAESGEYFGWSPSLTGWLAVPLLLILARVFREGSAMREDLEGTV